jgi:DNA (cytosine-5)-methyltransferase 1
MEVLGGEVAWHVEYDAAPSKILKHHWPTIPNYGDLTALDWSTLPPVDVITAGYPCQPFSIAGKRKGADDERHLWPYIKDAIRQLRPRLVILENVRGHLTLGFDRVLGDLAEIGYDARWVCLPASAAGAPHRRERIFIVAQDANRATGDQWGISAPGQAEGGRAWPDAGGRGGTPVADAGGDEPERRGVFGVLGGATTQDEGAGGEREWLRNAAGNSGADAWGQYAPAIERWEPVVGRLAPTATVPDGRGGKHRLNPAFVEWMMGLPEGHVTNVGLTRAQQLKALGNGVVPQQAALALTLLGNFGTGVTPV